MDDVLTRLQQLFREVLDAPHLVLTLSSDASSIEGYDSLAHINVLTAVEQEFGVRFELKEILELENTGDLVALIMRHRRVAA
jgi:acyl carrier protein